METIKEKIENWVNNLPSTSETKIIIKSTDPAQLCVTFANQFDETQEISLFFDIDMNPMFITSPLDEAESFIHNTNETLQTRVHSLDEILDMMTISLPNITSFNLKPEIPEEEEMPEDIFPQEYVEATEKDWEDIIVPEIEKYVLNDNYLRAYEKEEWIRRVIKHKEDKGIKRALTFLRDEIIQHSSIPNQLSKYIPRESFSPSDLPMYSQNGPSGASDHLKKYFHEQIIEVQRSKIPGVVVKAYNDTFHWTIEFSGFSETTQLGNDLMELSLLNHDFDKSSNQRSDVFIPSNKIEPSVITCEMKFKSDFPKSMPYFRLISPSLCYITDIFLKNELKRLLYNENHGNVNNSVDNESNENKEKEIKLEDINLKEVIIKLRQFIAENDLRVDLTSIASGNTTINSIWYTFQSYSTQIMPEFSDIEDTGRIYLPTSILSDMYSNSFVNLRTSNSGFGPMIFEIYNPVNDKKVYCGVLEFTAPENSAVMPSWVFENLEIETPNEVEVRRVSLPKCTFLKIKAHIPDEFNEDFNVKAMLEWNLRNFLVVSANQTIHLKERGHSFRFDVLEVKPGNYATITDLDISVELVTDKKTNDIEEVQEGDNKVIKKELVSGHANLSEKVKQCSNCKSFIPEENFDLHELTCARMNFLCKKCGTVVSKNKADDHEVEFHSLVPCNKCEEFVEKMFMLLHEANECSHRFVRCKYCEMSIRILDMSDHEEACGAITEPCEKCGTRVMRKYKDDHLNSGLCDKIQNPTTFTPHNIPEKPNKLTRSLFVCEKCQQPIEGFDELQVHYLTTHTEESENLLKNENVNEEFEEFADTSVNNDDNENMNDENMGQ